MSEEYKVGDMVRVTSCSSEDEKHGVVIGKVYQVVDVSSVVYIRVSDDSPRHDMYFREIEPAIESAIESTEPALIHKHHFTYDDQTFELTHEQLVHFLRVGGALVK